MKIFLTKHPDNLINKCDDSIENVTLNCKDADLDTSLKTENISIEVIYSIKMKLLK